ncbi:hypothetical protein [Streptomyces sp. NPDC048106]|uniref:hypothetical protein n=1 Tax=Streptomyces sp. NPDC048106 TaxID=3155750 RepID=UPI003456E225
MLSTTTLPGERPRPPREAVVVVRRGDENIRDFGWISGDGFCLGHTYRKAYTITCGSSDAGTAAPTPFTPGVDNSVARTVHRMQGFTDPLPAPLGDPPHQRYYTLTIVLDDPGPFRLDGDDHRGVLHQARAVLAPGRTVTFLEWGYSGPELPPHPKVCSTSTGRCVDDPT